MTNEAIHAFTFVVNKYLERNPRSVLHLARPMFPYLGGGLYVAGFDFKDFPHCDLEFTYISEEYIEKCISLAKEGKKDSHYNLYKTIEYNMEVIESQIRKHFFNELKDIFRNASRIHKDFHFGHVSIYDFDTYLDTEFTFFVGKKEYTICLERREIVFIDGFKASFVPYADKEVLKDILGRIGKEFVALVRK